MQARDKPARTRISRARGVSLAWLLILAITTLVPALSGAFAQVPDTLTLERVVEASERAFTLLVPRGWRTAGGIVRVDPIARGGPAQSVAAKVDFAVMSDARGTVMIRWLPDVLFFDMRQSPAGAMGLFPPGSNYNGMQVMPLTAAARFIESVVLAFAHPRARDVRVIERHPRPRTAALFARHARAMTPMIDFSHDAASVVIEYEEDGARYREAAFAVIENWGRAGAGMWGNRATVVARAPAAAFARWAPVLAAIQGSIAIDRQWLAGEIRGQVQRGRIVVDTMQAVQRIERAIGEHQRQTNAEIHNDMFLTLTEQEEFVNPFTREIEVGSNQWKHRWVNPDGQTIYTDREDYDPNVDLQLNRGDFKRTPVRKRQPR